MKDSIEVEAKFICPETITAEELSALLMSLGLKVEWKTPQWQRDSYLDTPDGQLLKHDMALRIRDIGGRRIGAFKGPATSPKGVFSREEIEWELKPEQEEQFDRQVGLSLLSEVKLPRGLDPAQLKTVLRVETLRRKASVKDENGTVLELALDEVLFKGPRGQAKHRELELELKQGDSERLEEIAEELRRRFRLEAAKKSKFTLGMELVG